MPLISKRRDEWRIPRIWKEALFKAKPAASTWMLAILLLEEAENPYCPRCFKLPNKGLANAGINRWAKWRALRELQSMGLILIEESPRKSPRVKVMWRRRT